MKQTIRIDFKRRNPETGKINSLQDDIFNDDITPRIIGEGGTGVGKSYALAMKLLKLSFQNKGVDGGLLSPDYALFNRDMRGAFQEISDKNNLELHFNGQRHFYEFPWGGHKLWVFSADTRFPGANLGWGGVNEFSITPKEQLEEFVERRIRKRCPKPQCVMVGTPDDPFGYLEDLTKKWASLTFGDIELGEAKDKDRPVLKIYRGSAELNSHNLKVGYIEEKRKTLDPMSFRLWVMGERVRVNTNAFYFSYSEKNNKPLKRQKGQLVHVGMDFNIDNMHAVIGHMVGSGATKEAQWFDEIVLKEQGADTEKLCRALKEWNGGSTEGILISCDSAVRARRTSGQADVDVIEKFGFAVRFNASNPRLRARQLRANGMFSNGRMFVDRDKCPVLHNDLMRCEQEKVTMEKHKDVKGIFSHASDGMDYVLGFEFPDLDLEGRDKFRIGKFYGNV